MLKHRVYEIMEIGSPDDRTSRAFDTFIITLIAANIVAIAFQTVDWMMVRFRDAFLWFEYLSVFAFTIEYLLRVWSSTAGPEYNRPIIGRVKFMLTPMAITDLLAVLPFYLPFVGVDLRFLRALRFFRVFRFAKLGRYSAALQMVLAMVMSRKRELVVAFFVLFVLVLLAAFLAYFAEHDAQPEAFPNVFAAIMWALTNITSIKYRGAFPVTFTGNVVAVALTLIGVAMLALPTAIMSSAFMEEIQDRRARRRHRCPHCGQEYDEAQEQP